MKSVYIERRNKIIKSMKKCGIYKAIITKPSNIFFLTGLFISPYDRFVGLFVSTKSNICCLILPELEKGHVMDNEIKEVVYRDTEDPLQGLVDKIGDCSVLGIEKNYISLQTVERIKAGLDTKNDIQFEFREISNIIENIRMIKGPDEIDKIKLAAQYADEILYRVVKEEVSIGMTEKQIKFELLKEISGFTGVIGEAFEIQVSGGGNSARPHGITGDRALAKGDSLVIDFGVNFQHYRSDITRTFFLGQPDKRLEKIYRVVLEAQKNAINHVCHEHSIKEVDLAARNIIEKEGYGKFFTHRTGHGLGIDIHELPFVSSINEEIMREGMVFTIEPGVYVPEIGGVRIEDDIVVTKEGGLVINRFPKEFEDIIIN